MEESEVVVSEVDAARYLGVSTSTLRRRRAAQSGPDYVQIGKLIRYRKQALERFLEKHSVKAEEGK